ncbi:2-dehydropantoate 2-reductase [Marinobacteraceae bacterium S3BR75-40.1]
MTQPRIAIFGAGSIGCYLGGRLLATGAEVAMIGRPRLQETIHRHGLTATDYQGYRVEWAPAQCRYHTDPAEAAGADLALLTVKSAATEDAGRQLARVLKPGAVVVCFQNGVSNADRLQPLLPEQTVLPGMVPFNVLQQSPGHFHQGTEGHLMVQQHPALDAASGLFEHAGLPLEQRSDMLSVLWSKLILNLNNPINALSGIPLKEELEQRDYRRCLALAQSETLYLLRQADIKTVRVTSLPTPLIPWLLRLPDAIFTRLAQQMLAIDPIARSSMWEDLQAGRPTEIEYINGEVVALARRLNLRAPVNQALINLIHDTERGEVGNPWSGTDLLRLLKTQQK